MPSSSNSETCDPLYNIKPTIFFFQNPFDLNSELSKYNLAFPVIVSGDRGSSEFTFAKIFLTHFNRVFSMFYNRCQVKRVSSV